MENFILWNAAMLDDGQTLSFAAMATAVKQLQHGTRDMVEHMLRDLGLPNVDFASWRVRHFVTDYLADDLDADEWQDVWNDHWRIDVQLASPVHRTWSDVELVRSGATDASWDGDPPEAPFECVVVADFDEADALARAEALLKSEPVEVERRRPDRLLIAVGRFDADVFEDGAPLAERIRELCRAAGGLTTWNELTDAQL